MNNATQFGNMFWHATAFQQDLSGWDVRVTSPDKYFRNRLTAQSMGPKRWQQNIPVKGITKHNKKFLFMKKADM